MDMVGSVLSSTLDKLAPTVYAQGGGYSGTDFGFDELWSEPRNFAGSPRNRATEPTGLGSVLPEGSNSNFAVPLVTMGGRGLGAGLTLFYNSRVWSQHGNAVTFSPVGGFPFAGFSLGFGRILTYGPSSNTKLVLVDPDGTVHYLGSGNAYTTGTYQTSDGTHITYVGSAAYGGSLYYNDGTKVTYYLYNNRLLPMQVQDSNGNYTQIAYRYGVASPLAIDFVTDTQGRQIHFNYNGAGNLISITAPGYGGTAENPVTRTVAQFDYQSRTLSYSFSGLTVENAPTGAVNVLRHVRFPGTSTGLLYSYSDYGMIYNVSNRRQMTIDGNGVISDGVESASVALNYPTSGSTVLSGAPAFTQRTESGTNSPTSVYTYSSTEDIVALTKTFTVTRPDSSTLNLTRSTNAASAANGLLVQSEIKNSSGGSMSKSVTAYANDPGGSVQPQSVISYDDANAPAKIDFNYDAYGNVTNKREYGFQIAGAWQVRRRTNYTYLTAVNYINNYLRSLVTEAKVYDALENTNDADDLVIAKTSYVYDDYAVTGGMNDYGCCGGGCLCPDSPGHNNSYNSSYTVRGNITGTTQWIDIAGNTTLPTRLKQYDMFGNVLSEMVSCCNQKVFTYVENDYWANPPTVTDGYPQSLHLTGSTTYDFNTGLPMYTSYANLGTTGFYYDAALRLIRKTSPTQESDTASYDDAAMTASFTRAGLGTMTNTSDGFARVIQTVDPSNGQVNTSYDAMGRVASRTNPFTAGGTPGPATTLQYDVLGRATSSTLPGGNTVQNTYSGAMVTMTDQVNRKIKRETDGLGRLVKVTEQDSNGALTQETNYSHNLLDKLTLVNQGNQMRAFKYDALGRLLFERIPEQTATINDGSGTYWTMKYTFTDFNAVATRTDARGVITNYGYDAMNRRISTSYNTAFAGGVAATPSVGLSYDFDNLSPTNGLPLTVTVTDPQTETVVYRESYGYNDTYKRLSSITREIEARSYTTSYQYGAGDLRSQITYPTGRVVNINRDSVGRVISLTDASSASYLSGVGYDAAGQVTGVTLGNGVAESYGYDANRMQLITYNATAPGGALGGLMQLSYVYQATAGQSGAGTTAGNAGQLTSMFGTIAGIPEGASYSYDVIGRLATSYTGTNNQSAYRRYGYDRWGNRAGVWDAVSGGNQIQSVTLEQSGGAPTNRITRVTNNGSTVNYSYDAAGNVTSDGVHSYQYDAENRVVNADGGATARYAYDHHNRRYKKTVGSAVTHYVWEGSQVIAEYDANTSWVIAQYVYYGSRMIGRVTGASTQYFLSDRLSTRLVLDGSGNVIGRQGHLPFGEDFGASGTQEKHHLTGYERDAETGLDHAINRGLSFVTGRFQSADPYRPSGHLIDPRSWNRYSYTRNNPINRVDRFGLQDGDPEPFECTNCTIDVNGNSGGDHIDYGRGDINLDLISPPAGGGQSRWEVFWNELTPCERRVAVLGYPLANWAVEETRHIADDVGQALGGGDDNYANAVRHCVWSCLMTIKISLGAATAWGNAHECDGQSNPLTDNADPRIAASSRMDLHNNDVGRTIGYNLGHSGSDKECIKQCKASNDLQRAPKP